MYKKSLVYSLILALLVIKLIGGTTLTYEGHATWQDKGFGNWIEVRVYDGKGITASTLRTLLLPKESVLYIEEEP